MKPIALRVTPVRCVRMRCPASTSAHASVALIIMSIQLCMDMG